MTNCNEGCASWHIVLVMHAFVHIPLFRTFKLACSLLLCDLELDLWQSMEVTISARVFCRFFLRDFVYHPAIENDLKFVYMNRIGIDRILPRLSPKCVGLWQSFLELFSSIKQKTWLMVRAYSFFGIIVADTSHTPPTLIACRLGALELLEGFILLINSTDERLKCLSSKSCATQL